jgi:WAS family protein 1
MHLKGLKFIKMSHELYEVPIIHQDLRQEDTIIQIAEAFDYLDACVNDIYRKIETKLSQTTAIVQNIQTRTLAARSKVEKLKGSKKATKVCF